VSEPCGVVIRRATLLDAEVIATIHVDAWRHNYRGLIDDATLAAMDVTSRIETWREALKDDAIVFVAMRDLEVVGWIRIGPFRQNDEARLEVQSKTPRWAEIHGLYVSPQAQRTGSGRALWNAANAWCSESGYLDIGLWVLAKNGSAIGFYETCGFHDQRLDQAFEINGQPLVESLMARRL